MNSTILNHERSALEAELKAVGVEFKGKSCRCPFHDDQHASAGIFEGDDGAWRFKCQVPSCGFAGDIFDVRAKLTGKSLADVLKEVGGNRVENYAPPKPEKPPEVFPSITALVAAYRATQHFVYTNPDTQAPDLIVLRRDNGPGDKDFIQCRPVDGGFIMRSPADPLPIFNRTRIRGAGAVVFVEGEKAAVALQRVGVVATTTPAGAGKASHADLSSLAGKRVYLWPDADPVNPAKDKGGKPHPKAGLRTGVEHMREVASLLERLEPTPELFWIDCDALNLPPKGDAFDFLAAIHDQPHELQRRSVQAVLESAMPLDASGEVLALLKAEIAGTRKALPLPWVQMSRITKALIPGMIMVLAGTPGSTKSLMLLSLAAFLHNEGYRIAVKELEFDRAFHLRRAMAQYTGHGVLTDPDWVNAHPEESLALFDQSRDFQANFGRAIFDSPDKQLSLPELSQWVEQQCIAGFRVIAIDPITAACTEEKGSWIADQEFMFATKRVLTRYGASLILVTHPKKGSGRNAGMDDLANGAAYSRFAQTVLWIERVDEPKNMVVKSSEVSLLGESHSLTDEVKVNRIVKILKATNSRGSGSRIAMDFSGETLCFRELGVIVKSKGRRSQQPEQHAEGF